MEALNRKPDLASRRSFMLDADTRIDEISMTVRDARRIASRKDLTDEDKGLYVIAAKILVNGKPIVYDDLMDCFTTEELESITAFLYPDKEADEKNV